MDRVKVFPLRRDPLRGSFLSEVVSGGAGGAQPPLTHRLLDQLTGAPTTVTVTGYEGDDPWQADDLIACVGQDAKRFGDATPAEQSQALSGSGPCQFDEGDPPRSEYRATAEGHHVHAHFDQPHCGTP